MKWLIPFFAIALLSVIGCQKTTDPDIDVPGEIQKAMEDEKIPSVVACVVKGDAIVWEGTYGFANVEHDIPASRNTVYSLQSIGKLVLSVTVMQLWEKGLIDLEADINDYLPFDVRNPYHPDKKITPYMILTHSSGLAWPADEDLIPDFHHFYAHEDPPTPLEWLPEYIIPGGEQYRDAVWKDFPPGTQYLYSNIATTLMGLIVEQISGMDYRDYCRENIFEPLEMFNTAYRLGYFNQEILVTPYFNNNTPMYPFSSRHYPAGFLNCDLEDFAHFMIACLNFGEYKGNRILERASFEKMIELRDPASGYGFLWLHFLGDLYRTPRGRNRIQHFCRMAF
jgi:CubicO group peptidase (beta-lactamase class C family)